MKKIIKNKQIFFIILFLLVGITFEIQSSFGEITFEDYCQLTIKKLRQEIFKFQELIKIEKYGGDKAAKIAEFDQVTNALYSLFDTTPNEYMNYMSRNSQAVNAYLRANPEIKQQIDELIVQRDAVLEEYESLIQ